MRPPSRTFCVRPSSHTGRPGADPGNSPPLRPVARRCATPGCWRCRAQIVHPPIDTQLGCCAAAVPWGSSCAAWERQLHGADPGIPGAVAVAVAVPALGCVRRAGRRSGNLRCVHQDAQGFPQLTKRCILCLTTVVLLVLGYDFRKDDALDTDSFTPHLPVLYFRPGRITSIKPLPNASG